MLKLSLVLLQETDLLPLQVGPVEEEDQTQASTPLGLEERKISMITIVF